MISAFTNSLKIPELRQRIVFTLMMVIIVRIGAAITLPGVDPIVIKEWGEFVKDSADSGFGAIGALVNVFSGGALTGCAIFALGIMPYISASIMMQLLTAVVPQLSKLAREDGGRQKINQYTRYGAIALCLIQGSLLAKGLVNPAGNPLFPKLAEYMEKSGTQLVIDDSMWWFIVVVATMTAGTMLLMWLGDQITERGIGNGMSLIISVNIISALPAALVQLWNTYISGAGGDPMKAMTLVMLFAFLLVVIAAVIAITQAVRKIAIQYAKRVVGRKVYGGQSTHLPLKVNYAGVMPIIFAQAILLFPATLIGWLISDQGHWLRRFADGLAGGWQYYLVSAILIFFFSYFWVATMFQPQQIADDLKKNGGYIPGVRPGKPTADFLDFTMGRLTFAGAVFLTVVAVVPSIVSTMLGVSPMVGSFFGGTSILILVGVLLDMMRHVETHLLQRNYDGFLRKGKIRGRANRPGAAGAAPATNMLWLYIVIGVLLILGASYTVYSGI